MPGVYPDNVSGKADFSSQPLTIKVGLTTYDGFADLHKIKEQENTTNQKIKTITKYLLDIETESISGSAFPRPLEFELYLGDYYQIYDWLRKGELQAAIVPPVPATLLLVKNQIEVIGEFPSGNHFLGKTGNEHLLTDHRKRMNLWGNWPLIHGIKCDPEKTQCQPLESGAEAYTASLEAIFDTVHGQIMNKEDIRCEGHIRVRYQMVSHFSASGFATPLFRAYDFLGERTQDMVNRGDEKRKTENAFWKCYFEQIRFNLDHDWKTKKKRVIEEWKTSLQKDRKKEDPKETRFFFFTYTGNKELSDSSKYWQLYLDTTEVAPPVPNDTFVIKKDFLLNMAGFSNSAAEKTLRAWKKILLESKNGLPKAEGVKKRQCQEEGYQCFREFDRVTHELFKRRIVDMLSFREIHQKKYSEPPPPYMAEKYNVWFEKGGFEFTVNEIFDLLKKDQLNSGHKHLSLVMPGGGVRSAYQSKLLDLLYSTEKLRNAGGDLPTASGQMNQPLFVTDVVGTSGGALVGLMAALREPTDLSKNFISQYWKEVDSWEVFSMIDALRWTSFLTITIVFFVIISLLHWGFFPLLRASRSSPPSFLPSFFDQLISLHPSFLKASENVWPGTSSGITILLRFALVLLLIPMGIILTHKIHDSWEITSPHWIEGFGFFVLIFLSHFCINFVVGEEKSDTSLSLSKKQNFIKYAVCIFLISVLALWVFITLFPWTLNVGEDSRRLGIGIINILGVNSIVLSIIALAYYRGFSFRLIGSEPGEWNYCLSYILGCSIILIHLIISYATLIATLAFLGKPQVEMTGEFWSWLVWFASVWAVVCYILARILKGKTWRKKVTYGFGYLLEMQARSKWMLRPSHYLVILSFLGILSWNILSAPSVYSNKNAYQSFTDKARKAFDMDGAEQDPSRQKNLQTNLIFATTDLGGHEINEKNILPGEHYIGNINSNDTFRIDTDNRLVANLGKEGWHIWPRHFSPDTFEKQLVDPAFASGSPFPVFPAHSVALADSSKPIKLVDGGYTHNIPILAAREAGGRQLLVVSGTVAEIEEPPPWWYEYFFSDLVKKSINLFPFLFQRAQEVDRHLSSGLFVAVLSPWARDSFPDFLEFTNKAAGDLMEFAARDITEEKRIGRIQSWGLPQYFQDVSPKPQKRYEISLMKKGWLPEVRAKLMKGIIEKTKEAEHPLHAVIQGISIKCVSIADSKKNLVNEAKHPPPAVIQDGKCVSIAGPEKNQDNEANSPPPAVKPFYEFKQITDLMEKLENELGWNIVRRDSTDDNVNQPTAENIDNLALWVIGKDQLSNHCKEIERLLSRGNSSPFILVLGDRNLDYEGKCKSQGKPQPLIQSEEMFKFGEKSKENEGKSKKSKKFIPAVVYDGFKLDASFNEAGHEGAREFTRKYKIPVETMELSGSSDDEKAKNLKRFLEKTNATYVVVLGNNSKKTIRKFLKYKSSKNEILKNDEIQKTKFALVDAAKVDSQNDRNEDAVRKIHFEAGKAAREAGKAAAEKTKHSAKRLAFIGGMKIPPIEKLAEGFEQGANPQVNLIDGIIKVAVSNLQTEAWSSPGLGAQLANLLIAKCGVGGIFVAAGTTSAGVYQYVQALSETKGNENLFVIASVNYEEGSKYSENGRLGNPCNVLGKSPEDCVIIGKTIKPINTTVTGVLGKWYEGFYLKANDDEWEIPAMKFKLLNIRFKRDPEKPLSKQNLENPSQSNNLIKINGKKNWPTYFFQEENKEEVKLIAEGEFRDKVCPSYQEG
ncbi:MAG: BMP family ABC transporter substrate-binding protein [Nitrospirales bacterium]|nr:BMP family ABC transporter substrate-binding protein [Nitrospirales bacterium]